ncbi:MAG: hypothetical protein IT518_29180 [Burkholderiales bacterium]|nr:hypothetical protein [Burkholderiales bacterium]
MMALHRLKSGAADAGVSSIELIQRSGRSMCVDQAILNESALRNAGNPRQRLISGTSPVVRTLGDWCNHPQNLRVFRIDPIEILRIGHGRFFP